MCDQSKDPNDAKKFLYSLNIVENGITKTLIPEGSDYIGGIEFVNVGNEECLLVYKKPSIILVDPLLKGPERQIIQPIKRVIQLYRVGHNKVLYMIRTKNQDERELHQLEVTSNDYKDAVIARLSHLKKYDYICTAGDLLVICSEDLNMVKAISMTNLQVKWQAEAEQPTKVCPGPHGTVLVACPLWMSFLQLSANDGSLLAQFFLGSDVMLGHQMCYQNDILFVSHQDAEVWESKKQCDLKISQYKLG